MPHRHREAQKPSASSLPGAGLLATVCLTGCASGVMQQYETTLQVQQREVLESMRLDSDATRLTRLGRFEEAQNIARTIEQREEARAQRCAEFWREQDEISRLSAERRYRELEQILRNRTLAPAECSGRRPASGDRATKAVDRGRTQVQNDTIGGREALYVAPRELYDGPLHSRPPTGEAQSLLMQAYGRMAVEDFQEAVVLFERVLALIAKNGATVDPWAGMVLRSLAWIAERQNKLPEALRYIDSAVALVEQADGRNARGLAPLLRMQSRLLFHSGDAKRSVEAGTRAFALYADVGESTLEYAVALNNLGVTLQYQGDTQGALDAYRRSLAALQRRRATAQVQEQATIDWQLPSVLSNLALVHWQRGEVALATEHFVQVRETMRDRDERDRYGETEAGTLARAAALAVEVDAWMSLEQASLAAGSDVAGVALDMLLERKSAVLERQRDTIRAFRESTREPPVRAARETQPQATGRSAGLAGLFRPLTTLYEAVGQGAFDPPSPGRDDAFNQELLRELESVRARRSVLALQESTTSQADAMREAEALDTRIKAMEIEIANRRAGAPFPIQREAPRQNRRAMLQDVQSRLPESAVLVEMVRYRPLDPRTDLPEERRWGAARYGAYLIRRSASPTYIDYGEAENVDRLVAAFRKSLARPRGEDARELGRRLDAVLMQPVRERARGSTQVFIAPEGMLNLVPFGALVDEGNRYLIETATFNYLGSGRELLRTERTQKPRSAPLILADPAFDGDGEITATPVVRHAERSRDFSGMKFDALPGTGAEGQAIKQMLPGAVLLTGAQATESALKQAKGPRVLHVATHGFFLEDLGAADGTARSRLAENPMLRSGLAFAGANRLQSAGDDGLLTALEAASLDLNGTKLVILSACETGVGEVRNGEGVFGLRRAFSVAGAETIVMSLWPVADQTTKDLMISYYRRLGQGESRPEALRQAQLEVQRDPRRSHPFFWASFISSGEWGTLE